MCHFDYSCSSWFSGLTKMWKSKLQTCQNKIVRFILNYDCRDHIGPEELEKVGWLDIQHHVVQLKLNHVHNIFNGKGPKYLMSNFTKIQEVHSFYTRSSIGNFHIPKVNGISHKTFHYSSINMWNKLPNCIKCTVNKTEFKHKVKDFLVNDMYRNEAKVFFY